MKRMMIFTVIAVWFCLFGNVSAEDEVIQKTKSGCQKIENPSRFIDKHWVDAMKKGGVSKAAFIISSCKTAEKLLTLKYGNVISTFSNVRLGIGQNVSYSYQTFCSTLGGLHERLTEKRVLKLLILISLPAISQTGYFNAVPYIVSGIPEEINEMVLIDIDILLYEKSGAERPAAYKKFYTALFTGDVDAAVASIDSMPDEYIYKTYNTCLKIENKK